MNLLNFIRTKELILYFHHIIAFFAKLSTMHCLLGLAIQTELSLQRFIDIYYS